MVRSFLGFTISIAATACNGGSTDIDDIPSSATTGTLRILLGGDATAAAGDEDAVEEGVDEVWLRVNRVEVEHENEGWIVMSSERTDIDLMSLRDGDTAELTSGDVYEGAYERALFEITDAWVVAGGEEYDLEIQGGYDQGSSELELDESYFVDADTETDLFVGWDVDTQLSGSDDDWTLKTDLDVEVDVAAD
jgi:hypothetical protein